MTSSSSSPLERGLDTMVLVYYLLQGHPAATACEQLLRAHGGWFTSVLVLVEAKNILTKVYSVDSGAVTTKLLQFAAGPVLLLDLDEATLISAFHLADSHGIDLTDAVLLHLSQKHHAVALATEDDRLALTCAALGLSAISPLNNALRQQVAAWESANLPSKGQPRILRRIHQWLNQTHPQAANDFWSKTGAATHLP